MSLRVLFWRGLAQGEDVRQEDRGHESPRRAERGEGGRGQRDAGEPHAERGGDAQPVPHNFPGPQVRFSVPRTNLSHADDPEPGLPGKAAHPADLGRAERKIAARDNHGTRHHGNPPGSHLPPGRGPGAPAPPEQRTVLRQPAAGRAAHAEAGPPEHRLLGPARGRGAERAGAGGADLRGGERVSF